MLFDNILVPFDESQLSEKALKIAIEIAKTMDSEQIMLLNVVEEIPNPVWSFNTRFHSEKTNEDVTAVTYFREINTEMKLNMIKKLENKIHQLCDNQSGISIKPYVIVGNPSKKISEFAHHYQIDLIVIGSVGLKGISRVIRGLGSVSRSVSEQVDCPILIVR